MMIGQYVQSRCVGGFSGLIIVGEQLINWKEGYTEVLINATTKEKLQNATEN